VALNMANQMKKLIVYYSLDGMTDALAKTMAQSIGADLLVLRPKNPIPTSAGFFKKLVLGAIQVFRKQQPELYPLEKNPAEYDLLFFGTPVWVSNLTPPFRTLSAMTALHQKKIALFCCYKGNAGNALANLKELFSDNTFIGETGFTRNDAANPSKATAWANQMVAAASRA
jgi:flavodoxin